MKFNILRHVKRFNTSLTVDLDGETFYKFGGRGGCLNCKSGRSQDGKSIVKKLVCSQNLKVNGL